MKRVPFRRKVPPLRPARQYEGKTAGVRGAVVPLQQQAERAIVAVPKFDYVRSEPLLEAVRRLSCMWCRRFGRCDPAHSNWGVHGKGNRIKASDIYIAALCRVDHDALDQGSTLSEAERKAMWWYAHVRTVKELVARGQWPKNVPMPDIVNKPEGWE